jgi:hypothetical protein
VASTLKYLASDELEGRGEWDIGMEKSADGEFFKRTM